MFDLFLKGGFLMYPIALCSIAGLALLINKFFEFRKILGETEKPLNELLKKRPQIMEPMLSGIENGCDKQELSVIGTKQVRRVERGLSWLGLIATIAPLIGLTGTVTGMIKAFMVIAESPSVNPSMLAGGI